jgi:hypothetical protein
MTIFTKSIVEDATLDWLVEPDYTVFYCPEIARSGLCILDTKRLITEKAL